MVENLAGLLDLEIKDIEKRVHEHRSDELSAMFNMLMEDQRKQQGNVKTQDNFLLLSSPFLLIRI